MTEIAIVGAGIGGLVTALALAKRGQRTTVYEGAPALGEVGAGISLTPNASRVLEGIGLKEFLMENSEIPSANLTRHYKTWDLLIDIQRGDARKEFGAPYYQIHRADLHGALVDTLEAVFPGTIVTGKMLHEVHDHGDSVSLAFADKTQATADILIAADGLRSIVRKQLFDPRDAQYKGQIAYRGLVERAKLSDAWHTDESQNLVGPGAVFVSYPVRQGKMINFVGLAQTNDWVDEGWSTPATKSEILKRYDGWHESVAEMVNAADASALRKWGLFGHQPLDHFVKGNIALLGDAAHPMLPFFGMGSAMAIEDGAIIARCLTELGEPQKALRQYEALRMERTHFIQAESEKGGERLQSANPDQMTRTTVRSEDSLGLFHYDALEMSLEL